MYVHLKNHTSAVLEIHVYYNVEPMKYHKMVNVQHVHRELNQTRLVNYV